MNDMEAKVHNILAQTLGNWVAFLKELVQTPSPSGSEQAAQELVFDAMQSLGLETCQVYPKGLPSDEAPCIVGTLPGSSPGRAFMLNAHIDTAPVEISSSWTHPPYAAVIDTENRLHGRGSLDDKAGIAMLLFIAEAFRKAGVRLPRDLVFASVVHDESSGKGTEACTNAGYTCDAGIIIDGTWPFRIIDAHLGQIWIDLEFQGRPAAACSLRRGRNPIDDAVAALHKIRQEIDALNRVVPHWNSLESPYFCNAGVLRAGVWPGSVPEHCVLKLQIGFPQPDTPTSMVERIRRILSKITVENAAVCVFKPGSLQVSPFANRGNSTVAHLSRAICRNRPGEMDVKTVAVAGHCDLIHLRKSNGSLAAACLYGPGGGGNPHARDEYYILDHFLPVAQNIVSAVIAHFCLT